MSAASVTEQQAEQDVWSETDDRSIGISLEAVHPGLVAPADVHALVRRAGTRGGLHGPGPGLLLQRKFASRADTVQIDVRPGRTGAVCGDYCAGFGFAIDLRRGASGRAEIGNGEASRRPVEELPLQVRLRQRRGLGAGQEPAAALPDARRAR